MSKTRKNKKYFEDVAEVDKFHIFVIDISIVIKYNNKLKNIYIIMYYYVVAVVVIIYHSSNY